MKAGLATLACLASLVCAQAAHANCGTANAVFADDFKDPTGGWDSPNEFSFGPKGGILRIAKGDQSNYVLNAGFRVRDADICVDAVVPPASVARSIEGLVFAATDYNNFFMMMVSASPDGGKFSFYRRIDGKWAPVIADLVPPATSAGPLIKVAPGEVNHLEVVMKANLATMSVNGQQVAALRLQAPRTDLRFGLYAEIVGEKAGEGGQEFTFQNYAVNDVK